MLVKFLFKWTKHFYLRVRLLERKKFPTNAFTLAILKKSTDNSKSVHEREETNKNAERRLFKMNFKEKK